MNSSEVPKVLTDDSTGEGRCEETSGIVSKNRGWARTAIVASIVGLVSLLPNLASAKKSGKKPAPIAAKDSQLPAEGDRSIFGSSRRGVGDGGALIGLGRREMPGSLGTAVGDGRRAGGLGGRIATEGYKPADTRESVIIEEPKLSSTQKGLLRGLRKKVEKYLRDGMIMDEKPEAEFELSQAGVTFSVKVALGPKHKGLIITRSDSKPVTSYIEWLVLCAAENSM